MPFRGDGKRRKKFGDCRDDEGEIQWDAEDYEEFAKEDEEDRANDEEEYDVSCTAMEKFEKACNSGDLITAAEIVKEGSSNRVLAASSTKFQVVKSQIVLALVNSNEDLLGDEEFPSGGGGSPYGGLGRWELDSEKKSIREDNEACEYLIVASEHDTLLEAQQAARLLFSSLLDVNNRLSDAEDEFGGSIPLLSLYKYAWSDEEVERAILAGIVQVQVVEPAVAEKAVPDAKADPEIKTVPVAKAAEAK